MMEHSVWTLTSWAAGLGFISAVSLPLGVLASFVISPSQRWVGGMAAFGGGALICALALELVAPHVQALEESRHAAGLVAQHAVDNAHGDPLVALLTLMFGVVIGGGVFILADQLLNAHGGFLRKYATSMAFLSKQKAQRSKDTLRSLANVEMLRCLPSYAVQDLVEVVEHRVYAANEVLFEQGDAGDCLVFIKNGDVALNHDGDSLKTMHAGDVIGEIALLTGSPRTATARAETQVEALVLQKKDFDHLRSVSPRLDEACKELASSRLQELQAQHVASAEKVKAWSDEAIQALSQGFAAPTRLEIKRARQEVHGSPMAIWLGTLIDGIPESFVIGTGVLAMVALRTGVSGTDLGFWDIIPFTFVGSLFLSNFPEAFSASITMRDQGYSKPKILGLWGSLAIVMSVAAGAGVLVGASLDPMLASLIEGIAGGAMLTMIASTMLPEAAHAGGPSICGFATLLGFLAATAFKLIG